MIRFSDAPKLPHASSQPARPTNPEPAPKPLGRPRVIGEPWRNAGISRATWYRRQKEWKTEREGEKP